ncbi:putative C2H2 type zinc finger domain protein [Neofusicoccum parvum]|nr:putative C2H2 type zinc finger domain protein [Neofusicoccum parvum]
MDNLPDLTRLAQAVGIGAAFYMSGYHCASDQLALRGALLTRDPAVQVEQWFLGWDTGRTVGPALVLGAAASAACLAWKDWLKVRIE